LGTTINKSYFLSFFLLFYLFASAVWMLLSTKVFGFVLQKSVFLTLFSGCFNILYMPLCLFVMDLRVESKVGGDCDPKPGHPGLWYPLQIA